MAVGDAIRLVKDVKFNSALRNKLNSLSELDLQQFLDEQGYRFTYPEFEDAVTSLHVQCQTIEQANEHMELATWLTYLLTVYK